MPLLARRRLLLSGLAAVALGGAWIWRRDRNAHLVPLPTSGGMGDAEKPFKLSVAYIDNPDQPSFADTNLPRLLRRTERTALEHLGIHIKFSAPVTLSIDEAFVRVSAQTRSLIDQTRIELDEFLGTKGATLRASLRESVNESLTQRHATFSELVGFVRPLIAVPRQLTSIDELTAAVSETQVLRIRNMAKADAFSFGVRQRYHAFTHWLYLQEAQLRFDVLVTNQLVAGAETGAAEIHGSLRGGVTAGLAVSNASANHAVTAVASLYPFFSDAAWLREMRDDTEALPHELAEREQFFANLLTHELGHMLLHLDHPFGVPSCAMAPAPLLKYRAYARQLDAARCRAAKSTAMKPGAYKYWKVLPLPR